MTTQIIASYTFREVPQSRDERSAVEQAEWQRAKRQVELLQQSRGVRKVPSASTSTAAAQKGAKRQHVSSEQPPTPCPLLKLTHFEHGAGAGKSVQETADKQAATGKGKEAQRGTRSDAASTFGSPRAAAGTSSPAQSTRSKRPRAPSPDIAPPPRKTKSARFSTAPDTMHSPPKLASSSPSKSPAPASAAPAKSKGPWWMVVDPDDRGKHALYRCLAPPATPSCPGRPERKDRPTAFERELAPPDHDPAERVPDSAVPTPVSELRRSPIHHSFLEPHFVKSSFEPGRQGKWLIPVHGKLPVPGAAEPVWLSDQEFAMNPKTTLSMTVKNQIPWTDKRLKALHATLENVAAAGKLGPLEAVVIHAHRTLPDHIQVFCGAEYALSVRRVLGQIVADSTVPMLSFGKAPGPKLPVAVGTPAVRLPWVDEQGRPVVLA